MKNSKISFYLNKALTFCYYALFIFTPLLMTSVTSELFEFNKTLFIYLVTACVLFLWLSKMILSNKIIIKKTWFDIPILLFLISQILSTIFSIDPHTSLFGYYGRFNGGLLSIICYLILYYGLTSNFPALTENFIEKLLKTTLFSSLVVILWGLPGKFGHDLSCWLFAGEFSNNCWTNQFRPAERLFSTLGQPNWLGAYLAINFFIGLYFFLKHKDWKYYVLNSIYLILNFTVILFTRSRSSLLAVMVGLFLIFIYLVIKHQLFKTGHAFDLLKRYVLLLVVFAFPILIFKTGVQTIDKYLDINTYTKIFNTKKAVSNKTTSSITTVTTAPEFSSDVTESGDIRKIVWAGAIDIGKQYPILGTGVETFAYSYYFVRPKEHNLTSEWDYLYNKAHNEFLNYFATTGFVGIGTYLLMIVAVIFYAILNIKDQISKIQFKNNKERKEYYKNIDQSDQRELLAVCLIVSYFTILITNFFGFSTTTINLFFYLIPVLLIIGFQLTDENGLKLSEEKISLNQKIYLTVNLLLSLYFIVYIGRYWLADVNYAKGDNYYKVGNYQEAGKYLDQALKLKYEHVYEDKYSYVLANLAFLSAYQKQADLSTQFMKLADQYNLDSLNASPENVLYWKTKAKNTYLYYQITQNISYIQQGVEALLKAQKLAPTDPKIPYSLAIFYSLMADNSKDQTLKSQYQNSTLEQINKTIFLKSNDHGYYLLKAQFLKKFGQREEARKTLNFILQRFNPHDEEVKKELNTL